MTTITIKLVNGKEVRRRAVDKDLSFTALRGLFDDAFPEAPKASKIYYRDEENDILTITNQTEWDEAKRCFVGPVLRLTLANRSASPHRRCVQFRVCQARNNRNPAPRAPESDGDERDALAAVRALGALLDDPATWAVIASVGATETEVLKGLVLKHLAAGSAPEQIAAAVADSPEAANLLASLASSGPRGEALAGALSRLLSLSPRLLRKHCVAAFPFARRCMFFRGAKPSHVRCCFNPRAARQARRLASLTAADFTWTTLAKLVETEPGYKHGAWCDASNVKLGDDPFFHATAADGVGVDLSTAAFNARFGRSPAGEAPGKAATDEQAETVKASKEEDGPKDSPAAKADEKTEEEDDGAAAPTADKPEKQAEAEAEDSRVGVMVEMLKKLLQQPDAWRVVSSVILPSAEARAIKARGLNMLLTGQPPADIFKGVVACDETSVLLAKLCSLADDSTAVALGTLLQQLRACPPDALWAEAAKVVAGGMPGAGMFAGPALFGGFPMA